MRTCLFSILAILWVDPGKADEIPAYVPQRHSSELPQVAVHTGLHPGCEFHNPTVHILYFRQPPTVKMPSILPGVFGTLWMRQVSEGGHCSSCGGCCKWKISKCGPGKKSVSLKPNMALQDVWHLQQLSREPREEMFLW